MAAGAETRPSPGDAPRGVHAFVAAYPEHLARVENGELVWRDGHRTPLAELGVPDGGAPEATPRADPRHAATESVAVVNYAPIYDRMYGDCRFGEVEGRLADLRWNRGAPDGGRGVRATSVNGVAARLQAISDELDRLGPEFARYLRPLGGTYICRNIARSSRRSLHGYGIAVDINPAHGDYWLTASAGEDGRPLRRNRIPFEIVEIFERHGFVWGGRWHRFDTFHFEYRPEYLAAVGGRLPERLTSEAFAGLFGGRRIGGETPARARAPLGVVFRMSYRPRAPGAQTCFRWVRQPGPRFGTCVGRVRAAAR
jgi:hypothetical protein